MSSEILPPSRPPAPWRWSSGTVNVASLETLRQMPSSPIQALNSTGPTASSI